MAIAQLADLDFNSVSRILNLPDGTLPQHPATVAQLNSAVEGLAWKDSVRIWAPSNVNLAAPGATLDGITMVAGDRFGCANQTAQPQNGLYIWNGAATPATRSLDANTSNELEGAIVTVEEGTSAGSTFRQTQVNFVLDTGNVLWVTFGTSAPAASETVAGIAELATQSETDAGTDDLRIVTPLKLANLATRKRKAVGTIGDGSATQIDVTHNFATFDVLVELYQTAGNRTNVNAEVSRPNNNTVRFNFAAAPTAAQYSYVIIS